MSYESLWKKAELVHRCGYQYKLERSDLPVGSWCCGVAGLKRPWFGDAGEASGTGLTAFAPSRWAESEDKVSGESQDPRPWRMLCAGSTAGRASPLPALPLLSPELPGEERSAAAGWSRLGSRPPDPK